MTLSEIQKLKKTQISNSITICMKRHVYAIAKMIVIRRRGKKLKVYSAISKVDIHTYIHHFYLPSDFLE